MPGPESATRRAGVALAAILLFSMGGFPSDPAGATSAGGLVQPDGPAGCISDTGSGGACTAGVALRQPLSVAVSPDGENAYATSNADHAVLVFDRDPATGALNQEAGTDGCISDTGSDGRCAVGRGLDGARSVVVSPDGANVYAVGYRDDAVVVFDRDPSSGALTQKAGASGCVSDDGADGCTDGVALQGAHAVTLSPDGTSLYVAAYGRGAVAVFDRDGATGVLTQKTGAAGCLAGPGAEGCSMAPALGAAAGITVSPDGASVYVASAGPDAVVVLSRDPATGALTAVPGSAGCISSEGGQGTCATGVALGDAWAVTVSPDGRNVYVAGPTSGGLAVFDREPSTGALTQKAGTTGCLTTDGAGGACATGTGIGDGRSLVVSPDGATVFLAGGEAVAVLDRHPVTGALLQQAGAAACTSESGSEGACTDGRGVGGAFGVGVSPDGANVYVAGTGSDALAVFDVTAPGTPFRRPDLEIRRARGEWLGAGVLNEDGHDQTASVGRQRLGAATFLVRVRNQALVADRFTIAELAPRSRLVRFRYFRGRTTAEVTSRVQAGTYRTRTLAPGEGEVVRVEVLVRRRARPDVDYATSLRGSSSVTAARTDTVSAVVHVR